MKKLMTLLVSLVLVSTCFCCTNTSNTNNSHMINDFDVVKEEVPVENPNTDIEVSEVTNNQESNSSKNLVDTSDDAIAYFYGLDGYITYLEVLDGNVVKFCRREITENGDFKEVWEIYTSGGNIFRSLTDENGNIIKYKDAETYIKSIH